MALLKDIAAESGVSIRTVNRVLKGNGYVRDVTQKRVLEVAERLQYRPNLAARALKTGKSSEVGVVLGSVDELHLGKLQGFEQRLRSAGFSVHVLFGPADYRDEAEGAGVLKALLMRRMAAAALLPHAHVPVHEAVRRFRDSNLPYVVFDSADTDVDTVRIDRQQGLYEAVKYLASRGHNRIAYLGYVGPRSGDYVSGVTRLDGYNRAITELNTQSIIIPVQTETPEYQGGCEAIDAFLRIRPRPDAVQVYSDIMAAGFLASLHENGVRVPEDVAVIGFDNRYIASFCWPRLTTVAQPNREVGIAAADMLLKKLRGEQEPDSGWSQSLPTRLVVRESA